MSIEPRCVLNLLEMQSLPPSLPLHSTAEGWEDLGRIVTEANEAQAIGGLVYIPKWATAPYSALN